MLLFKQLRVDHRKHGKTEPIPVYKSVKHHNVSSISRGQCRHRGPFLQRRGEWPPVSTLQSILPKDEIKAHMEKPVFLRSGLGIRCRHRIHQAVRRSSPLKNERGEGCRREARSKKIQDKACNQMTQHDRSRSKLQNKTVPGLCQSSKNL